MTETSERGFEIDTTTIPGIELSVITEETFKNKRKYDVSVIFLSYVCDDTKLTKKIISDFLVHKKKSDKVMICAEVTKAGKLHHHAVAIKNERWSVTGPRFFDIDEEHPNMRFTRKDKMFGVIDYVAKYDKHPLCHNLDPTDYSKMMARRSGVNTLMINAIVEETDDADEAMEVLSNSVGCNVKDLDAARKYIVSKFPPKNPFFYKSTKWDCEDFTYPEFIREYVRLYVDATTKYDRYPLLVVSGLTRRQKTTAIRALGPHLYFKGDVDLCSFVNIPKECKFIVFDDISQPALETLFYNNALMLGMEDGWTEKFMYIGKKKVENHLPVILLCNQAPECIVNSECSKYNSAGYYYQNSWHIDINQHMSKLPYKYLEESYKKALDKAEDKHVFANDRETIYEFFMNIVNTFGIGSELLALEMTEKQLTSGLTNDDVVMHKSYVCPGARSNKPDNKWLKQTKKQYGIFER